MMFHPKHVLYLLKNEFKKHRVAHQSQLFEIYLLEQELWAKLFFHSAKRFELKVGMLLVNIIRRQNNNLKDTSSIDLEQE